MSMPLHWSEVEKGLKVNEFTIFNAMERLHLHGDIFTNVLGKGINLQKVVRQIQKTFDIKEVHKSLQM